MIDINDRIIKFKEHYKILDLVDDFTTVEFTYSEFQNRQRNSINLFKLVDTVNIWNI